MSRSGTHAFFPFHVSTPIDTAIAQILFTQTFLGETCTDFPGVPALHLPESPSEMLPDANTCIQIDRQIHKHTHKHAQAHASMCVCVLKEIIPLEVTMLPKTQGLTKPPAPVTRNLSDSQSK